jgi:hypothetical protein
MNQRADGSFASSRDIAVLLGGVLTIAAVASYCERSPGQPDHGCAGASPHRAGDRDVRRLWIATVTAVTATLAFNFFFLPPLGT